MAIDKLHQLRLAIRQRAPTSAGDDGELCAEAWLKRKGWDYFKVVEQGPGTMGAKLREYGGKRPDFFAIDKTDDALLVLDAKHVRTAGLKTFVLTDAELGQYRGLKMYLEEEFDFPDVLIIFMVIPKESKHTKMVFVLLDDFDTGTAVENWDKPATAVSLLDREELWTTILPEDAFPQWAHKKQ